jgi:hypothetical protein
MQIRSIRQLTHDSNHNAFTGARFFQGALYVSYRQGDAHVCQQGKLMILRSRDEGVSFDQSGVIRGKYDTRDAHLYQKDDKRLFVCGFEATADTPARRFAGCAYTDNGLEWSPWTRYTGCDGYVLWRPEYFRGVHYCAGYKHERHAREIAWFTSGDGLKWKKERVVHAGPDLPNECSMDFHADGSVVMLVRREHASRKPLVMRSKPPYKNWSAVELDVPLAGPALWLVGQEVWFSGRWFITPGTTHVAIFKLVEDRPVIQVVLPSGPGFDLSYMGIARFPNNRRRFALSYYSGHNAPADPAINQWSHPQIFLADALFDAPHIQDWKVSDVVRAKGGLAAAKAPDPDKGGLKWHAVRAGKTGTSGFVDAAAYTYGKKGIACFVADIEVGPVERGVLFFGYDAPVRIWLNGKEVHAGHGTNPAVADQARVEVKFRHGHNRIALAMDTSSGTACGIFARFEAEG